MASNPYMTKTEALLREGKAKLEGLRARTEKAGAEARTSAEKKLREFEARYADVSRRFDELRNAGRTAWPRSRSGWRRHGTRSRRGSAGRSSPVQRSVLVRLRSVAAFPPAVSGPWRTTTT